MRARTYARKTLTALLGRHALTAWTMSASVAAQAPRPLLAARLYLAPRLRILCGPDRPGPFQTLTRLCALSGYAIRYDPNDAHDVAVHFAQGGGPCRVRTDRPILNRACTDISKRHVAAVFERTFGYPLAVDPLTYRGLILAKSDANNTHDGVVLEGPLPASAIEPGRVYQRYLDTVEDRGAVEWRTPLYGGLAPLTLRRVRPLCEGQFSKTSAAEAVLPKEAFSRAELAQLFRFAQTMGLDYGEVDIMRDRGDGRIYVVDVANTPAGPIKELSPADMRHALTTLCAAFEGLIRQTLRRPF